MTEPQSYILIIDDDEDDLQMFSSGLEKKGIKVKTFDSPTKGMHYLRLMSDSKDLPSLVIMDYNMPTKNGLQVLLFIKGNAETKNIPVVIYSTSMPDVLRKQLSNAGALDCFNKPWNRKELNYQIEIFQDLANSFISNKFLALKQLEDNITLLAQ
jgi:response regulator RpfG family c-di-GMP phosphodiesterase